MTRHEKIAVGVILASAASPAMAFAYVAAVPEPATWMMMILGFGVIGWRVRSRRSAAARPKHQQRSTETV
jgi:hypothetical protein